MKIIYKKVDDLIPYINNSRTHSEEQVNQICASINEFGFTNPLLIDEKDNIIAGHGRLLASKKLKMEEVPCIVLSGLTEAQKKAYIIADNKMALNAGWDEELLKIELENLKELDFDLELTGFDVDELDDILGKNEEEQEIIEDEVPEVPEEPKAKLGDIYQLGNHRLMCGDSTNEEDVAKLMNGNKADMVFTDPPYNVNAESRSKKNGIDKIMNDNMEDEEFEIFIDKVFKNLYNFSIDESAFYIWHNYKCQYVFEKYLRKNNFEIKNQIIWVKDIPAYTTNLYRQKHENCFEARKKNKEYVIRQIKTDCFYCNKNSYKVFVEDGNDCSVWNIPSIQSAKSVDEFGRTWFKGGAKNLNLHVTQKPISLCAKAIRHNLEKNGNVLDLFGGSGSTLMACQQLGKTSYTMELDPHYISVIIERYINFTGNDVYRLNPDGTKTNWRDIKCEKGENNG